MSDAFGYVSFFITVFVPSRDIENLSRFKRVKLGTAWCEYADREKVVADFKANNLDLRSCDIRADFTLRQSLDCEFEK